MGHTLNSFGKPVFDDTFNLPGDLQAGVDFADTHAFVRGGTAAERTALLPGQIREGMLFSESDTGDVWQRRLGNWSRVLSDTGWKTVGALVTGWSVQTPDTFDYRVRDGILYLRGRLNATAAAAQTNILATPLPASARPSGDVPLMVGTTGGTGASFVTVVQPSGQISCYKASSAVGNLPMNAFGGIPVG